MRRTLLALAAILMSGEACSQGGSPIKVTVTFIVNDGGAVDAAPAEVNWGAPNARCCVLPTDGGVNPSDQCSLAAHGAGLPDAGPVGLMEPCWDGNDAGTYATWTCGADAAVACGDNGLSCEVGSSCRLADVSNASGGCLGTVQPCFDPSASAAP